MPINHNIVFVKNKLISIDTILPILIELKKDHGYYSDVVVFDKLAHKAINENIVIKDGIEYVGREIFITNGIQNKFFRRIYLIKNLFLIFIKSVFGANLLHFGALDQHPLKIFGILFKKNVYRFPGSGYNFQYPKYSKYHGNKPKNFKKVGDNCVMFGGTSDFCDDTKFSYNFVPPRSRKVWVDYIRERSNLYFNKLHGDIKLKNGFFVIATGPLLPTVRLRKLVDPINDFQRLFMETLNVLTRYSDKIPILIKPHPLTDIELLKKIIYKENNMFITYLHPSILSLYARVFIANQFSNILADAYTFGVDTIEYTNYNNNLLNITHGKSLEEQFVTYFINNDYSQLEMVVSNIVACEHKVSTYKGIFDNNSKLINKITRK